MTPRRLLVTVLMYGLVLAGLVSLQGALLVLAIPFMLYLAAGFLARPSAANLRIERSLSAERAAQGEDVLVRLAVTNAGEQRVDALIADQVPQRLQVVGGVSRVLAALEPQQTVELEYTARARRGFYQFTAVHVTLADPFELFPTQTLLGAPGQLLVVPDVLKVRRVSIRPRRTNVFAGQIPARLGGPGVEFFGVREYQAGDPTRWVNGRLTARHPDSVYVNVFDQERVADVGVIVDARQRSDLRTPNGSLFEHSVHAAASLADAFIDRGNRVGLLMYGNAPDWTLPGYGKLQRERILRALARAEQGNLPVFERLDNIPARLFPARSQLVLISPLLADDLPMLVGLRARGYHLLVISPDPVSFELHGLGASPAVEFAGRVTRIERRLLLDQLRQAGITVVDWQVHTPFQQVASAALSRPVHIR